MTAESTRDVVVAERPQPSEPRPYAFPSVARSELDNGLTILVADLPGRPLVSATMIVPVGAADEPASDGGAWTTWHSSWSASGGSGQIGAGAAIPYIPRRL